jgi:hypothetical protein
MLDYTDVNYAGVIRMRGLPFNSNIRTVTDFLGDVSRSIKPGCVVLCEAPDGRRNGEAYVEFTKEIYANEAQKKDRQSIGSRYVEIFKVRPAPPPRGRAAAGASRGRPAEARGGARRCARGT